MQPDEQEELRRCQLVINMTMTDGWKIIEDDLKAALQNYRDKFEAIPLLQENINDLAMARSNILATKALFNLIQDYRDRKEFLMSLE